MISLIVATSKNHAIGKDNLMPWHISEDLKYFKRTTSGHPVIMGYNTYLSLGGRPLPNRRNIVVSTRAEAGEKDGVEFFNSLPQALEAAATGTDEVFVIGGGQIYRSALQFADRLYITEIDTVIENADTFFPDFDRTVWKVASQSPVIHDEKSGYDLIFKVYSK